MQIDSSLRHLFGVDTQLVADGTDYVVEVGADRGLRRVEPDG